MGLGEIFMINSRDNACIRTSLLVMSISEGSCTPNAELRNRIKAVLMKNSARVDGLLQNESFKRDYYPGELSTLANGSSIGNAKRNSRTKTDLPASRIILSATNLLDY
jgi:hypothetical protein